MIRGVLVLALPLPLALAACGDATIGPGEGGPTEDAGAWETERLAAKVGADQAPLLVSSGNDALVIAVSEEGTIQSHLSTGRQSFEAGEPLETDLGYLQLADAVAVPGDGWFTLGSGGLVERDGDEEFVFDPVAFRSADGLTWERVGVTGFTDAVDISDLAVVDGRVVAAGSYRTAEDPSMGGAEAHLWTSVDAESFAQVDLPGVVRPRNYRNESWVGHIVVAGDRVLAAGQAGDSAAVWASDDAARTWQRVSDPNLADSYVISGLATVGDVVIAGIGDGTVTALRSIDLGATWAPVENLPVSAEEVGWAPVWADRDRFWTLTGVDDTSWSRPEVCYADLDQCGRNPEPRVVTSTDGSDWTAVELPGEPDEIAGTADGRVLLLGADDRGLLLHTLPAGTSPPTAPAAAEPKTAELVTVDEEETPEVGVRYHAPLYVHCGMGWLWLGETTWRRTDRGPDVETGAGDEPTEDWPLVGETLYGFATLVDVDHLEYTIDDDQVIATYERADGAPGCD